jgi:glucokinase
MFCAIYSARGGLYIAGRIAQKIEPFLIHSAFRARFENKGCLSAFTKSIPTRLLPNPDAALMGAAWAALELRAAR